MTTYHLSENSNVDLSSSKEKEIFKIILDKNESHKIETDINDDSNPFSTIFNINSYIPTTSSSNTI